jgi:hypothetical protein
MPAASRTGGVGAWRTPAGIGQTGRRQQAAAAGDQPAPPWLPRSYPGAGQLPHQSRPSCRLAAQQLPPRTHQSRPGPESRWMWASCCWAPAQVGRGVYCRAGARCMRPGGRSVHALPCEGRWAVRPLTDSRNGCMAKCQRPTTHRGVLVGVEGRREAANAARTSNVWQQLTRSGAGLGWTGSGH